jgi:hypothetical protein
MSVVDSLSKMLIVGVEQCHVSRLRRTFVTTGLGMSKVVHRIGVLRLHGSLWRVLFLLELVFISTSFSWGTVRDSFDLTRDELVDGDDRSLPGRIGSHQ